MLTMRNWMFIKQYKNLRQHLLSEHDLRALGDFAVGAFDEVANDVLSVTVNVFHRMRPRSERSIGLQPTPPSDLSYDRQRTSRKRAATLCHEGRHTFDPTALKVVPEWPLVYWWGESLLERYSESRLIGEVSPPRFGANTGNNARFSRRCWETDVTRLFLSRMSGMPQPSHDWVPYVMGAKGQVWIDQLGFLLRWTAYGLEVRVSAEHRYGPNGDNWKICNQGYYFRKGIAIAMIGSAFGARVHRFAAAFDSMGTSLFPTDVSSVVELLNEVRSRAMLESLNPTIHFQVGDVNRLPLNTRPDSGQIFTHVESAFGVHESHREASVEFQQPGPSPGRQAQAWAQLAVDRPEGAVPRSTR